MVGRVARWVGLVQLGWRRVHTRALRTAPRQTAFTISGIAIPVALLLVVTSLSLGLATGGTVASADVDYWIVPESGASSAVVGVEGPRFGQVHETAARLAARDGVRDATPVLVELLRLETPSGAEWVVTVGMIPGERPSTIAGVSTAGLTPGDPHYATGTYEGPLTNQVVLSSGASALLGATAGDGVRAIGSGTNRSLTVVNVSGPAPTGDFPVAVVHLAELQSLTGAAGGDTADQLLVRTSDPSVRPALEGVYPRSTVVTRGGLGIGQAAGSALAVAVAAAALAVALVVGGLSASSSMGVAVAASSRERALLSALGFSPRSRAVVLAIEALVLAILGGLLGVAIWLASVPVVNRIGRSYVAETRVVSVHAELVAYGLGVAVVIGLLVLPYLLWIGRRTTRLEALVE